MNQQAKVGGKNRPIIARWWVQASLIPFIRCLILFLAAGRLDWLWAWLFAGVYLVNTIIGAALVRDAALIAEREQRAANVQAWDKWLVVPYNLSLPVTLLVAGLDAGRFGWSPPQPAGWHLVGLALQPLAALLLIWAMRSNTFFSGYARIQHERNHRVVTDGPYRYVRHPGYLGMILFPLGLPLLLGARWAWLPALLGITLIVVRTRLEDAMLRAELPGYTAYAERVRWRLLPPIW